jgi:hypothetical protein
MSLATLKKKTGSLYNNQSVGYKQFSLNGGYRSQGWVGQTMLSRSLPRTLARGNAIRGHGGSNGFYNKMNGYTITSGLVDFNNNKVIKPSVGNPFELFEIRNKCLKKCNMNSKRFNIVKSSGASQDDRIKRVAKCALAAVNASKTPAVKIKKCANLASKYMIPSYININTSTVTCSVTKNIGAQTLTGSSVVDKRLALCIKALDSTRVGYNRIPLPGN